MAAQLPHNESYDNQDTPQLTLQEPVIRSCVKHPKVETRLTCTHCETPICPKCMVVCEVGMKCKKCTSRTFSHVVKAEARDWILGGFVGFMAGMAFGFVMGHLLFGIGYFALLLCFFAGKGIGNLVHRCARFKMVKSIQLTILIAAGMGMLFSMLPFLLPALAYVLIQNPSSTDGVYYFLLMRLGAAAVFLGGIHTNFHHFRQR